MIDYCQKANLHDLLSSQATDLVKDFLIHECSDDHKLNKLLEEHKGWKCKPRIVGQEKSGLFLFTWFMKDCPCATTFLATYEPKSKLSKLLFYQEKLLNIINATVNGDLSLLAFTIMEESTSCNHNSSLEPDVTYKSYIAEISPISRVFAMESDSTKFQKVQFLSDYPSRISWNKYQLLFFQHKERIQLYTIALTRSNDQVIITQQPITETIADTFIWAKFDLPDQRLYYLQLKPKDEVSVEAAGFLYAVDFKSNGEFIYTVNFLLPIQLKMEMMQKKPLYNTGYYSNIVSCALFNMNVLTTTSGSFYVCFQHILQENKIPLKDESDEDNDGQESTTSKSSSADSSSLLSISSDGDIINYTVICLHGCYSLNCSVSLPLDVMDSSPSLYFALFNDYVQVALPNQFIHLLDISCEHEPVHNMLLKTQHPFLPDFPTDCSPLLSTVLGGGSPHSTLVFENKTMTLYALELNHSNVFKTFIHSKPQLRLAILHACINHFKDKKLTKSIIERVCKDPANVDTEQMLKEYLILVPYTQMKQKTIKDHNDLKLFPFTTQSCFRGQIQRNSEGHRDVFLTYKPFGYNLSQQLLKVLWGNTNAFWRNLSLHLKFEVMFKNKRIPLSHFHMAGIEKQMIKSSATRGRRNTTVLSTFEDSSDLEYTIISFRQRESNDDDALEQETKENEVINSIATYCLVNYVSKIYDRERKSRIIDKCKEYMTIRGNTITSLWTIVVKALDHAHDSVWFNKNLHSPTVDECELAMFLIVERLKVIIDHLCYPRFPRMDYLLATLSFRCLTRRQFLTYLEAAIFKVDAKWVRRAIFELKDTPENVTLKQILIMRLSKSEAEKLLSEWNHPSANHYLSIQIAANLPSEAAFHRKSSVGDGCLNRDDVFLPLESLLEVVKFNNKPHLFRQRSESFSQQEAKMERLSNAALANTISLISR